MRHQRGTLLTGPAACPSAGGPTVYSTRKSLQSPFAAQAVYTPGPKALTRNWFESWLRQPGSLPPSPTGRQGWLFQNQVGPYRPVSEALPITRLLQETDCGSFSSRTTQIEKPPNPMAVQ